MLRIHQANAVAEVLNSMHCRMFLGYKNGMPINPHAGATT